MNCDFFLKKIKINNQTKTAVSLSKEIDPTFFSKYFKNKKLDGWIYSSGNIEKITVEGISFYQNEPVIILPFSNCKSIFSLAFLEIEEAILTIKKILMVIIEIKKMEGFLPTIYFNNIFFIEDKILLLSSEFFEKFREISHASYTLNLINNPYLTEAEQQNSYVIAVLLYKILTDHFPFEGKNEDEILTKIRHSILIKPHLINPDINLETSKFIFDFFKKKKYLTYSLENWLNVLEKNYTLVNEVNKKEIKVNEKLIKKIEKKYKLAYLWDKNYKVILSSLFIALISLSILYYFVYNFFKPRLTKGYTPKQVVETYYNCFNSLDHSLMSDCVIGNAATKDLMTIINLSLKNRQLQAYYSEKLNEKFIISPLEWFKKGKPDIYPPYILFGIENLKILEITNVSMPLFMVEYDKYISYPNFNSDKEKETIKIFHVKEKVFLKLDKKDWVISDIERIEEKELK